MPMMITFYRRLKNGRMRYYSISNRQGHLFTPYSFQTIVGNSVSAGSEREYLFETRSEMDAQIRVLVKRRIRDGYKILYSYFRKKEFEQLREALSETG